MPAQIRLTHEQLETLADQGWPVVVIETPQPVEDQQVVEGWICDPNLGEDHRSLIVDTDGNILSDLIESDS